MYNYLYLIAIKGINFCDDLSNEFCGWHQDPYHRFKWVIHRGASDTAGDTAGDTADNSAGDTTGVTGPSGDRHNSKTGRFIYSVDCTNTWLTIV